jgi:hypothetical protein
MGELGEHLTREEPQMARPMFFYTGIYDDVADADADADYEAIKSLYRGQGDRIV